jgi:predicted nucleotidyltransferase
MNMDGVSATSERLRRSLVERGAEIAVVLEKYAATSPRVFGSVARGDARSDSDLDLLVDLVPGNGNELLRVSGIAEELSEILGVKVDVVAPGLLRDEVSVTALADAVAV